jgi:hypothetical protein
MRLNDRLKAIEQRATPPEHGIVIVKRGETVEEAVLRAGLSEERKRMGVLIVPEKNVRDDHAKH